MTSYHDLHITTATIPRTAIFNLPYGYEVTCTRVGGWRLWDTTSRSARALPWSQPEPVLVAGEYDRKGLRLDVAGHIIVDSLGET